MSKFLKVVFACTFVSCTALKTETQTKKECPVCFECKDIYTDDVDRVFLVGDDIIFERRIRIPKSVHKLSRLSLINAEQLYRNVGTLQRVLYRHNEDLIQIMEGLFNLSDEESDSLRERFSKNFD